MAPRPRPTRFGPQPARVFLEEVGLNARTGAERIEVPHTHLARALRGALPPSPEVRERLPLLLGVELDQLFTPQALADRYRPWGRPWKTGKRVRP